MKSLETLLRSFIELHPEDAARAFEGLDEGGRLRLFSTLPSRIAVSLLQRISPYVAAPLLIQLESAAASELLRDLPPRIASTILHQYDKESQESLLAGLEESVARPLRSLASYSDDTAGGIMEPRVVSISSDLTAQQATTAIRKAPRDALHYLYVTDRDGTLQGVLNLRDLLLASPRDPIEPLIRREVSSVPDTLDREDVVQLMREKRFLAIPVVDFHRRLIGVIKHSEVLQAGQEEAFEDLQKIVGAGAGERALSPVSIVVKSRLPWLLVNLLTGFMAAAVIGMFEDMITRVAALAVLLPVVAGQGGNTGAQSLAVVMRGLALREVIPGSHKKLIVKELVGGTINGVAVAFVTAGFVFVWRVMSGDTTESATGLSLVIFLAMIVNMAVAALAGAIIPLVLQALGRDPAQSASIFLTTVTDIVGFAAFLGFASVFMSWIT